MPNTFTWTYDAASGVYKNSALSGKLLMVSARAWKFVPFTKKVDDYGPMMGQSVTLIYYKPVADPTSGKLEEDTRIPIDQLEMGQSSISVFEWGRGVEWTHFAQQLGKFDPKNATQKALTDQMNQVMDVAAASEFTSSNMKIKFIPTTLTGGTFDTDGTPSTQALVNVTADHLGVVRDYMAKDLHVPFYDGEHYIGLFATKACRGLKQDRRLEAWHMYLRKGDLLYRGEFGQIDSIRCSEITNDDALSNSMGASNVLGEGVVFGDDAVARAEVEAPEVRAQPNYKGDFGRRGAAAWYGIVGFGVKFQSANDREARGVHITSG
jgi:hypothetical protein